MRVTDSLLLKNNRKKRPNQPEEDESTLTYQERKWEWFALNQQKSTFASPMDDGINTAQSVFDRTAVFRTQKSDPDHRG